MAELKIKNLTYSIGDKTILDNISFSVTSGDVVAVVACTENVGCTGQNKVFNVVWKGIADVAANRIIAAIWVFNDYIVTEGYIINVIFRRAYRYLFKEGRL